MLLIAAPSLVVAAGGGVNKTKKQDFLKLQNISENYLPSY